MWYDTTHVYLTSATGSGKHQISAFDAALRNAGIGDFNLIRVTSIVPPGVPLVRHDPLRTDVRGLGRMLPAVYEKVACREQDDCHTVGVGVGFPEDPSRTGVIFTDSIEGDADHCESRLREMVDEGMGILGRSDIYTFEMTAATVGAGHSVGPGWHSAVASLAFLDRDLSSFLNA